MRNLGFQGFLKTIEKYLTKYEQKHAFIKDVADKIIDGQLQGYCKKGTFENFVFSFISGKPLKLIYLEKI